MERIAEPMSEMSDATSAMDTSMGTMRTSNGTHKPRKSVQVTGNFIRHEDSAIAAARDGLRTSQSSIRLQRLMKSYYLANCMALVVLLDAYCTCSGIDARAAGEEPPTISFIISDVCLVLYTLELFLIFYLYNARSLLRDWMMILDWVIVCCGWLEFIFNAAKITQLEIMSRIKVLRVLRLVRIFRLIRLLKRVRTLKELHKLATMMATCMRTLLWCFLLCFIVMTGWAMLLVEVVDPIVKEMVMGDENTFHNCNHCLSSTTSVMEANLLLFKTVIAGDSWGVLAVPIITQHPATAIIFIGSQLTIVFGVVNLIVAVVVDTFAEARENDVQNLAEEMEEEIQQDSKVLAKVFQRINKDGSGKLSLEDLIEGARTDPTFQSRLRVMDIDENDLQQLFQMIDTDGSGTIESAEFIGPLSRWAHDSKTAPRFIKYNMLQTMHLQEDLIDLSSECFNELVGRIDDLSRQLYLKGATFSAPGAEASEATDASKRSVVPLGEETVGIVSMKPTEEKVAQMGRQRGSRDSASASGSETDSDASRSVESGTTSPLATIGDIHQPKRSAQVPLFLAPTTEEKEMHEQQKTLELLLEATVAKLEQKLDVLLKDSKKIKALGKYPRTHNAPGKSRMLMSPRASDYGPATRRPIHSRPALHPEAFRSMYMARYPEGYRSGNASEALKSFGHRQSKGSMGSLGETWPPLDLEETKVNEAPRASTDRAWRSFSRSRAARSASRESNSGVRSFMGSIGSWI